MQTIRKTHISSALIAMIGIALIALLFIPYLRNGLWFDDSLNSQTWGMVQRFHTSVWAFSMQVTKAWWTEYGRVLFGWPAIYGFFYLIRDVRMVRIADISLLLVHIGVVVYLLRLIRVSWPTIGVFLLFLVSLFQIRHGDDPIAAYATFCQVLGLAITIALIFLVRWKQTGSVLYLAGSVAMVILSMLCYELNAIFFPVALAVIFTTQPDRRARNCVIVLVPLFLFLILDLYVKHGVSHPYPGSAFGSVGRIPAAYLKQFAATLPGSFYILRGHADFHVSQMAAAALGSKVAWTIAVLSIISYVFFAKRCENIPSGVTLGMMVVAAAFVFLPPALISVSARYQEQLGWGDAHIPVYYQYFGMAFLGAEASALLCRRHGSFAVVAIAPIFAIYVAANWIVNMHQAGYWDSIYFEPRDSFVSALKIGLLDPVRDGDVIEIADQPIFINGNLIYQTIQKNVSIPNETAIAGWFESSPRKDANHYRLYRDSSMNNAWRLDAEK